MSVKSEQKITASDLAELRTAILTLYSKRNLTISGTDDFGNNTSRNFKTIYDHADAWFNNNCIQGELIKRSSGHLGDVIRKVLVINDVPNLMLADKDDKIFADGTSAKDLTTWINQYKNETGSSSNHGCRGACVGLCKGGCSNTADGTGGTSSGSYVPPGGSGGPTTPVSTCNGCGKSCSSFCYLGGSADGGMPSNYCVGCGSVCRAACSGCTGNCASSCSGCTGTCASTCNGCSGCYGSCSGGCGNGCATGCVGCSSGCQYNCTGGCALNCTNGCFGTAKNNTYT